VTPSSRVLVRFPLQVILTVEAAFRQQSCRRRMKKSKKI